MHGWIISSKQKCVRGSHLTAYFNDLGVGAFSGVSDFKLSSLALVENLVGIALKSGSDNENEPYEHIITSSLIVGKTQHSYCNPSSCWVADCSSREGFYSGISDDGSSIASLTKKIKTPYVQSALANTVGNSTLNNIYFFNYRVDPECQVNNYALKTNPRAPDYTLPTIILESKLFNVDENSIAHMSDPNPDWVNDEDCGNWDCTGLQNAIFKDKDGSILGNEFGGDIIPKNPSIVKRNKCYYKEKPNGYFCPKSSQTEDEYIVLIFESLDADKMDRTFSPIYVNSFGSSFKNIGGTNFNNDLNSYMDHTWDRFYTGQKRLSRFPSLVYTNVVYNITSTGTLPAKMQFRLQGNEGIDKSVIVTLNYDEPKTVQVVSRGERILPIEYKVGENPVCSFSDPHGTNRWFHEDAKLQFVMRGDSELIIERINSIQLTMEINTTEEEFFADNGQTNFIDRLAAVLNIPTYRIRVASVRYGSIILDMFIDRDESLQASGNSTADLEELEQLNQKIAALAESGELEKELGVDIMSMQTKLNNENGEDADSDGTSSGSFEFNDDTETQASEDRLTGTKGLSTTDAVIIIVTAGVSILGAGILILYILCRSKESIKKVYPNSVMSFGSSYDQSMDCSVNQGGFSPVKKRFQEESPQSPQNLLVHNLDYSINEESQFRKE